MGYPYGRDIIYTFYPLADNEALLAIPTQTPTIYVFTDTNVPTRDAAQNGTNALATISSWTQRGSGFDFTTSAISDPDPDSTQDVRTYWLGINFLLKTAGQVQTVIRSLEMERVTGHHKQISITPTDILNMWPEANAYVSEAQMIAFIDLAKEEIKAKLQMRGFEWSQIYRPDRLNLATTYKTLTSIMASQRRNPGDNFDRNYEEYKSIFISTMSSLQLEYDSYKTGEADSRPKAGGFSFVTR